MNKNRVAVIINGRQYTVVSDRSQEYLKKLADHLSEKVQYVRENSQNIMGERPIVLAALNICDEYFTLLDGANAVASQTERYTRKMEELTRDNERLNRIISKSEFEIDVNLLQNKLNEAEEEIKRLKEMSNIDMVEQLKKEHKMELEALRIEYEAREREILGYSEI